MTILVTGATGAVGAGLSTRLSKEGLSVRVMTRSPETSPFPKDVQVAKGDFSDLTSLRSAVEGAFEAADLKSAELIDLPFRSSNEPAFMRSYA
ncbi:MAG: NAD(P)H-binding protein [Sphingomonadales bacterium]|nr:NAD(P)H-binding protein [Sphingomonadales bacterium]